MVKPRLLTLSALIFSAAAFRLLPHPWNFTPIGAIALFGGAQLSDKRLAFLVPLTALVLSDLIIGFYPGWAAVYGSFAITVLIGISLQKRKSFVSLSFGTMASAVVFFLVTNFGDWLVRRAYPLNMGGLIQCYIAAIPFFRNTVLGDAFFGVLMFGGFELAQRRFVILQEPAYN